jgi:hypothetical protein
MSAAPSDRTLRSVSMAGHDFCGGAVPVMANEFLDCLQAAKGREAVILKNVFNLSHPKADRAINSSADFGRDSIDQFLLVRGSMQRTHGNPSSRASHRRTRKAGNSCEGKSGASRGEALAPTGKSV